MSKSRKENAAGAVRFVEEVKGILAVQLYDARTCRAIISEAERLNDWGAAEVGVEEDDDAWGSAVEPETRLASAFTPALNSPIARRFDKRVNGVIKPLVMQSWGVRFRRHSGTHLIRYAPGGFYVPHTDAGLDESDRGFTVICYLNDDFEGGRTSFPPLRYSVSPRPGKAVIFPATYLHCAEPVISGEKYVIVTWLMGREPIQWF